jgi:hypothetical protein
MLSRDAGKDLETKKKERRSDPALLLFGRYPTGRDEPDRSKSGSAYHFFVTATKMRRPIMS